MGNLAIKWAIRILHDYKYQIHTVMPEVIQNTPWSEVYQFKTNKGLVFLKKVKTLLKLRQSRVKSQNKSNFREIIGK